MSGDIALALAVLFLLGIYVLGHQMKADADDACHDNCGLCYEHFLHHEAKKARQRELRKESRYRAGPPGASGGKPSGGGWAV